MYPSRGIHMRISHRLLRRKAGIIRICSYVDDPRHSLVKARADGSIRTAVKFVGKSLVNIVSVGIKDTARQQPLAHRTLAHLTLCPRGVSESRKTTLTSSSPEARSIPSDCTPQSVAGARFATTMIFLPISCSGV